MPLPARQLAFFGKRSALIDPRVVQTYVGDRTTVPIPAEDARLAALREWVDQLPHAAGMPETSIEQTFNGIVLGECLGYTLEPSASATAYPKTPSEITHISGTPDVTLGHFAAPIRVDAVLELKPPGTDLDAPQSSHKRKFSPVDQAFDYGTHILGVRWVLVSDMRLIRLYSVESDSEYEEFDLTSCIDAQGQATPEFRRLYFFLSHDSLVDGGAQAPVAVLLEKSFARQLELRQSFYSTYFDIRVDLRSAIADATTSITPLPTSDEVLEATQRLLDRMMFLYYCEDHPEHLIPPETVRNLTDAAARMPGSNPHRIYDALKDLFREVDVGSSPASGIQLAAYNGELFKDHPLIDHIELPDTLHRQVYQVRGPGGRNRVVRGVWGLHVFDFWAELNEHLLGHVFEESLSDVVALKTTEPVDLARKLAERKQHGIYYTDEILSDYLARGAINAILSDGEPDAPDSPKESLEWMEERIRRLVAIRAIDPACGSGAFLVSAYQALLREYLRMAEAEVRALPVSGNGQQLSLTTVAAQKTQAALLRDSLYGADLLPQAVEISKLALWLRSARKGEKIANLGQNLVSLNSLRFDRMLALMNAARGTFDVVLGNPPWGGEIEPDVYAEVCAALGIDTEPRWDSWELFLQLSIELLRPGGRIAMVLPDTLLSPEKQRSRRLLVEQTQIEKLHNLGPDWFGKHVRMGTCVIQARKGTPLIATDFDALLLTGSLRRQVLRRQVPLTQAEARFKRLIPQARVQASPTAEIELFRSSRDDTLMSTIESASIGLAELCERSRGEEMAKSGLLWICPSCLRHTTPGVKKKGGGYKSKTCVCGFLLTEENVTTDYLVVSSSTPTVGTTGPFIDGDDIARRYRRVAFDKKIRLDLEGWDYKDLYAPPKILIRQAGVGLLATLDESGAYCPQSVYLYRVDPSHAAGGYTNEYLLGALLSRTMTYYVFKRFGEVDAARAYAKLTHKRLETLPVPRVNFADAAQRKHHDRIVNGVKALLDGKAKLGGTDDLEIEQALRSLWTLTPDDGAYITGEFAQLPASQAIRDLFPAGRPHAELQVEGAIEPPATVD